MNLKGYFDVFLNSISRVGCTLHTVFVLYYLYRTSRELLAYVQYSIYYTVQYIYFYLIKSYNKRILCDINTDCSDQSKTHNIMTYCIQHRQHSTRYYKQSGSNKIIKTKSELKKCRTLFSSD